MTFHRRNVIVHLGRDTKLNSLVFDHLRDILIAQFIKCTALRSRAGHGSKSRSSLDFFQASIVTT